MADIALATQSAPFPPAAGAAAPALMHPILEQAAQDAADTGLTYAGSVAPRDAWYLVAAGEAVLVDVRSAEECKFVGHVPGVVHIPWATGTALTRNPRFVRDLQNKVGRDAAVLLLCRSGKRSAAAAEAAAKAGFGKVFNILEGFEGDLDQNQRRGTFNGWRHAGLPWVQD